MMHTWFMAITGAWLGAASAPVELKLEGIQAAYGRFGPERPSLDFYPGDEVFFRYLISGVQTNAEGRASGEVAIGVTSPDGKEVLNQAAPAGGLLALGGGSLSGFASVRLPADFAPGTYTLTVRFTDQQSSRRGQFQRRFNVKPAAFAVIMPRFFYDEEGKVPAPTGGVVGQTLYFRLNLVGFDRSRGRIDAVMDIQALDKASQETMPKPLQARLQVSDPNEVKAATNLTFSGNMVLNRAGAFTLRITLTDRVGEKSTKFEAPLRVTEP